MFRRHVVALRGACRFGGCYCVAMLWVVTLLFWFAGGSLVVMIWGCLCWRWLFGWLWVFVCGCVSNFRLTVVLCISGY